MIEGLEIIFHALMLAAVGFILLAAFFIYVIPGLIKVAKAVWRDILKPLYRKIVDWLKGQ